MRRTDVRRESIMSDGVLRTKKGQGTRLRTNIDTNRYKINRLRNKTLKTNTFGAIWNVNSYLLLCTLDTSLFLGLEVHTYIILFCTSASDCFSVSEGSKDRSTKENNWFRGPTRPHHGSASSLHDSIPNVKGDGGHAIHLGKRNV